MYGIDNLSQFSTEIKKRASCSPLKYVSLTIRKTISIIQLDDEIDLTCNLGRSHEILFNIGVRKYLSTIFRTPDNVIVTDPCCVGLLVQSSVHI